ncbi:DUF3592 domain-containing protein [Roseateles saccharophilus]|uniref:Uncharacterized protein DUF3592 n=1 Tax=Roseateles saccharophilus TaxID=304 RepID=A0A4R3VE61_ROSSA|nr:DUF3592 domain-containing protein [Roseateles saccharophilus]MDG0834398.1 DUF3592 domain-containing protein [Roseateles saccharophilus]TCV02002.1 uncharacterized protein DUF3592 [Roseateles saccharophilus]
MTLIKLAFIVCGLLLVGAAWWSATMNARAADWPDTRGVIVHSEHRQAPDGDNDSVRIEYDYQVAGQARRGSKVGYAGGPSQSADKAALVARYPVGLEVRVYYDPADPGRAVLERSPSRAWIAAVLMGVALVAIGLFKDL